MVDAQAAVAARRLDALPAPHGTAAGYKKAKCRCPACTAAWADAVARYRASRAARENLVGGPGSHTDGEQKRDARTLALTLVMVPTEAGNTDPRRHSLKSARPAPGTAPSSAGSGIGPLTVVVFILVLVIVVGAGWWGQSGQGPDRPNSDGWRPRW
ncbi:MAG: hypothetical protein ACRENX_09340 [Candidatus Dormibacteria bacterium]